MLVIWSVLLFAFGPAPHANAGVLSNRTASVRSALFADSDLAVEQTDSAVIPFPHTEHVAGQGMECVQCHQQHSGTFLPALSTCLACHAGTGFPHDVHFREQGIVCSTCHDPHGPDPMPCVGCHGAGGLGVPHYLPALGECRDCHG